MTADPLDPEFDTLDRHLDGLFAPVRPGASLESRLVYALRNERPRPKLNRTRKAFVWATAATVGLGAVGGVLSLLDNLKELPLPGYFGSEATALRTHREAQSDDRLRKEVESEKGKQPEAFGSYELNAPNDGRFMSKAVPAGGRGGIGGGIGGIGGFGGGGFQGGGLGLGAVASVESFPSRGGKLFEPTFEPAKALSNSTREKSEVMDQIVKETKTRGEWVPVQSPAVAVSPDGGGVSLWGKPPNADGTLPALARSLSAADDNTERYYRKAEAEREVFGDKLGKSVDPGKPVAKGDPKDFDGKKLDKDSPYLGYYIPGEGVNKPAPPGQPAAGNGTAPAQPVTVQAINPTLALPDKSQAGVNGGFGGSGRGFGGGGFGSGGRFGSKTATDDKEIKDPVKVLTITGVDPLILNDAVAAMKAAGQIPDPAPQTNNQGQPAPAQAAPTGSKPADPPVAKKIVIRSGEIEFEVESFDNAVAVVTGLTAPIPGGYVSTVNSEKLPNGKVRGVVVVRIPPEKLDQFVLDLRRDLGKTGELKGQKIGSQDITKQYTDLESRLRAARAMEERLLGIIKEGKGSIKELLEAEKELGVWRTKIEETEGELKYYANLAALSTLTITIFEKEIRASLGVTESERVSTGVEVEDVEGAFRAVQQAVADAKGRVTKSELKQVNANVGQFSATLHFEVSPEASGPIRDRLKQLGRVARLEIDRVQQADSGQVVAKDAKVKRGDTQFQLQLYNLANIQPRETTTLTVAAGNVSAAYEALRDAVSKVNGRVFVANVNETDKQNVTGSLQFDVKRADEGAIKTALDAAGDTVSRHVTRAAEGDAVTDTKVRFNVALESADRIKPRETVTTTISAGDVSAAYAALRETVTKVNGRVQVAQVNETDKQNVTAAFNFEVKKADEGAVRAALLAAGEAIARSVIRAPENEQVTDSKVGFKVTLQSANLIRPRETVSLGLVVPDVSAAYQNLREVVAKANGQVITAQLNETDKQNVTATLHFQVKRAEEPAVRGALDLAGEAVGRTVVRAAEGTETTDAKVLYQVSLSAADRVRPREATGLGLEVTNVEEMVAKIASFLAEAKGRQIDARANHDRDGKVEAALVYDVPLAAAPGVVDRIKSLGKVRVSRSEQDKTAPEGRFAVARIVIELRNAEAIVGADSGVWPSVKKGLSFSSNILLTSLTYIVIGLCAVLPWALVGFGGYKLVKRVVRTPEQAPAPTPPPAERPAS
jgi:hypothetical protein